MYLKYLEWGIVTVYFLILCRIIYTDFKECRIEPWTNMVICLLAGIELLAGTGVKCSSRILGAVIIALPMLLLTVILKGGFGGGDIKLMWASGLLLGYQDILLSAVLGIFLSGIFAGIMLLLGKMRRKDSFALGPFLAAGIIGVKIWTSIC